MHRMEKLFLTLLLALLTAVGIAQDTAQPAQPAAPMAPGGEVATTPELPDVAWVRLAHFSPNAPELTVSITPTSEDVSLSEGFEPVSYETITEYIEVPTGNYAVSVQGVEGTLEDEFSFARGNYYTLAAIGMVLPAEAQTAEEGAEDGGGFVGFFQNLFGSGEGDRDALALQFTLLEDDLTRAPEEGMTQVRLVHAAPGTQPIDLAVAGEQGTLVDNVEFGNASRYQSFEGPVDALEVRISGSRAATMDLSQLTLEQGNINTIYVIGTPVEAAPLEALASSIAPVEAGSPAGEDVGVAAQGSQSGETAGGGEAEGGASEEGAADDAATDDAASDDAGEGAAEGDAAAGEDGAQEEGAEDAAPAEPAPEEPAGEGAQ